MSAGRKAAWDRLKAQQAEYARLAPRDPLAPADQPAAPSPAPPVATAPTRDQLVRGLGQPQTWRDALIAEQVLRAQHETRRAALEAERAELDLSQRSGALYDREQVEGALRELEAALYDRLAEVDRLVLDCRSAPEDQVGVLVDAWRRAVRVALAADGRRRAAAEVKPAAEADEADP